ncbi:guanylate kinase [candidate division KSB1 bacterium]
MNSGNLEIEPFPFVVSAPSGTGKTTILGLLVERDPTLEHVVSTTTRKPREVAGDGRDYHFVDQKTFTEMIDRGEFVEWARVFRDLYGTTVEALEGVMKRGRTPVMDLDVQGADLLRRAYPASVTVFIAPPSLEALRDRLKNRRTESGEDLDVRLKTAVDELKRVDEYNYLVINDKIDETVERVESILTAEKSRLGRIELKDLQNWII